MKVEITQRNNEDVLVASSRQVAEKFGKEHKNVVRDIEKLVTEIGSDLSASILVAENSASE